MQLVILFIISIVVPVVLSYKFPENFKRCHMNDADLDNCLKTTIKNALELIGNTGIPSLNLPPIDPIAVEKLEIGAGSSAVHLVQRYSDTKILGLSQFSMENAHLDIDKKVLTFTQKIPRIDLKAKYDINGKVMVMPFFGTGDSVLTLFDAKLFHTITFVEENKNGKSYFKIISYTLSIVPNGAHYHFDNLFNGDKQLSANILKVLNDNWKDIYDDVKEGYQNAYAEIFKTMANGLFNNVPIQEIFLS